jgi:hypothetical protein
MMRIGGHEGLRLLLLRCELLTSCEPEAKKARAARKPPMYSEMAGADSKSGDRLFNIVTTAAHGAATEPSGGGVGEDIECNLVRLLLPRAMDFSKVDLAVHFGMP